MREILFRGKRLDNGEWAYGDIIHRRVWGHDYIAIRCSDSGFDVYEEHEVDPTTVGQCTGLTDKNGVKIFEGDILRKLCPVYELGKSAPTGERWVSGIVIWDDSSSQFPGGWALSAADEKGNPTVYVFTVGFEVIGNIHDNPELLEEANHE